MKSALLLGILFFATTGKINSQNPIASQSPSYREASAWIIEFMRTKYGATDRYMEHLADDWKAALDEAKKQGLVLSYKAFIGPPANKEDWDVMTMIEVKDLTSPTEFYNRLGAIHAAIIGSNARDEEATKKRSDIREVLGMKVVREAVLLPHQK
jgi:hypothetical protein